MMEKQLIPKLRFPEFKSEFVKFEFSEIAKRGKKSYNPNKDSENLPCIELESLTQETGQLIKTFDSINLKSNKTRFSKNEVLFGKLRPYLKKYLLTTFEGVCTSEIWVFQGKLVSNPFLYYLIQTDKFNFEANVSSGSKMPRTDWDYLSGIKFSIPNNSKEQQKIASFLTDVDGKITKLTKKKELLEQYKKGIMQKIFNQELRFKDDNGNNYPIWEEKKLADFKGLVHGDGDWILSKDITKKGDYKIVQLGNIGFGLYVEKKLKTITKDKFIELKGTLINKGDLLINRMVDGALNCCILKKDGNYITSVDICWIRQNDYFNNYFLMSLILFSKNQNKLLNLSSGSGRVRISKKNLFNKFSFNLPSKEEQIKIVNFLSDIDVKIEALNNKIENCKSFKKGLLQQMFV